MQLAEESAFGVPLSRYGAEIKGSKLLGKKRFRWSAQHQPFDDDARRKYAGNFLEKGRRHLRQHPLEFAAFGQASIRFAHDIFNILRDLDARIFASMIPRGVRRPKSYRAEDFLRKDHVFLLERYFYFLEHQKEDGLLIFDETDKTLDRAFVGQVNRYFADTATGRYRAGLVVPVPVFVSSDMAYPVQAADVVVYVINWGYRRPNWVPPPAVREEIRRDFNPWLQSLLFRSVKKRRGARIAVYSIVRVGDPYESRRGA